jgi:hypothetical protein
MCYFSNPSKWSLDTRTAFRNRCATAAAYISADRVSRDLPSLFGTMAFFVQIFAGFWKTIDNLGDAYEEANPASRDLNRAPHNLAFGTLYFWLPFAVLATAFVGGAQTENSVPRILERLRLDVQELQADEFNRRTSAISQSRPGIGPSNRSSANPLRDGNPYLSPANQHSNLRQINGHASTAGSLLAAHETPSRVSFADATAFHSDNSSQASLISAEPLDSLLSQPREFPHLEYGMPQRWSQGGLPVWQPDKFHDWTNEHAKFFIFSWLFSVTLVAIPSAAAIWISWRTPTEGFGCRTATQSGFFISWLVNFLFDWLLWKCLKQTPSDDGSAEAPWRLRTLFWLTFTKDLCLAVGAIVTLTYSAIGVFNSCSCWSKFLPDHAKRYISLPQEQFVFETIKRRMKGEFAYIIAGTLGIEFLIFLSLRFFFNTGHRVLMQRDMDKIVSLETWNTKLTQRFKRVFYFRSWFERRHSAAPIETESSGTAPGTPPVRQDTGESLSGPRQNWLERIGLGLRRRDTYPSNATFEMSRSL